jgi:uncharacterized protein (DUF2384 family)
MNPVEIENQKAAALTRAALECAQRLGFTPANTAYTLGVPQGVLGAMKKGERTVNGVNGEAERADALVRVVKRLQLLLGDSQTLWRSWLRRENQELEAKPIDVMMQRDGVIRVADYLEKVRSL